MVKDELCWIDAHHHLWDLDAVDYPWLMAQGEPRFFGQPDSIRKNYLVEDYLQDTGGRISRSVHVQVGADSGQELLETEFVERCSKQTAGRFPAAAVVAMNLSKNRIEQEVEAHLAFGVTRGVRQIIGKSPDENHLLPAFDAQTWIRNWRVLKESGLSFDLQLTGDQYAEVFHALERVPDLSAAICHLASPWDQSAEGFEYWRSWMKKFASLPGVHMKISGFCMFGQNWDRNSFLTYARIALDCFGANRCMLGSNFPVDGMYVSFEQLFSAWQQLTEECSLEDAVDLAGETAARFYRL